MANGKKLGFVRPQAEHHAFRAQNHFAAGFGRTPESKGFVIKDECDISSTFTVLDQGQVGDCTANGGVECMLAVLKFFKLIPQDTPSNYFSRYYLYAKTRQDMGVALTEDTGATITDMVRALMRHGVCKESIWSSNGDAWAQTPTAAADAEAEKHQALRCYALSDVPWMKACLSLGLPVVFGVSLFQSFESLGADGYMPMPTPNEPGVGGHCMTICGYRKRADGKVDFKVLNSWGQDWAASGFCWMPQEYFDSFLACDAWTIHQAEAA